MDWSEQLGGGLLRAVPAAVVVLDAQRRIVLVNDHAERLFGWAHDELAGRDVAVLLGDEARRAYPPGAVDDDPPGPRGTLTVTARRRDGAEVPVETTLAAADTAQGRYVVAVVRDRTAEVHAGTEQARLRQEAQRHRRERLEGLGQLAGGIAHDFNNMLGVVLNYAGFIAEEAGTDAPDWSAVAADAEQIMRAGRRGTELTHRLLAFARREVVRPEPLDLDAVLERCAEAVQRIVGDAVTLRLHTAGGLPPITCDPGQLEQLLVSLAGNARDAMPDGGDLLIETARRRIGADDPDLDPGEYVLLRVADTGHGMADDVRERAFEPFFTTKVNGEGTGLGLATVYGTVTQAGGRVQLASAPGAGTTVTVLLPAGGTAAPEAPAAAPAVPTGGRGETLLVVEDEDALREVAGRILSGAGYRVLAAEGGPQALALAAGHDGAIDLLVSDVVMPGMLGKELAERLVTARPDTRVLYMSGYAQPVLASQGTLDPGVALLEKPFTADDLLRAVRSRLDG